MIRRSINFYARFNNIDVGKLNTYVEMLTPGDHIIADKEWIALILKQINQFSDEYTKRLDEISKEHAKYYYARFKDDPFSLLKFFETLNWCKISYIPDGYAIIFDIAELKDTLQRILEVVMDQLGMRDFVIESESKNKLFVKKIRK